MTRREEHGCSPKRALDSKIGTAKYQGVSGEDLIVGRIVCNKVKDIGAVNR